MFYKNQEEYFYYDVTTDITTKIIPQYNGLVEYTPNYEIYKQDGSFLVLTHGVKIQVSTNSITCSPSGTYICVKDSKNYYNVYHYLDIDNDILTFKSNGPVVFDDSERMVMYMQGDVLYIYSILDQKEVTYVKIKTDLTKCISLKVTKDLENILICTREKSIILNNDRIKWTHVIFDHGEYIYRPNFYVKFSALSEDGKYFIIGRDHTYIFDVDGQQVVSTFNTVGTKSVEFIPYQNKAIFYSDMPYLIEF